MKTNCIQVIQFKQVELLSRTFFPSVSSQVQKIILWNLFCHVIPTGQNEDMEKLLVLIVRFMKQLGKKSPVLVCYIQKKSHPFSFHFTETSLGLRTSNFVYIINKRCEDEEQKKLKCVHINTRGNMIFEHWHNYSIVQTVHANTMVRLCVCVCTWVWEWQTKTNKLMHN